MLGVSVALFVLGAVGQLTQFFELELYGFWNILGLLVALFTGWFMHRERSEDELRDDSQWYGLWRGLTRFVVVPAVALILITGLI